MFRRAACLVIAAAFLPALAMAQVPGLNEPRTRLRDRYRSPQSSQKLDENVRKLKSDDTGDRLEGVRGLGEVNDPKAREYLLTAASDPDARVRIKAIDTLGNVKATEATPLLIQQLFMRDTDIGTKQRILASLGKIGDKRATGPILDFLARDMDPAVLGNAIFALGDIGDPAALPALETIAKDGHEETLRGLAASAARKIRERPAPPVIPPALAVERPGAAQPGTP